MNIKTKRKNLNHTSNIQRLQKSKPKEERKGKPIPTRPNRNYKAQKIDNIKSLKIQDSFCPRSKGINKRVFHPLCLGHRILKNNLVPLPSNYPKNAISSCQHIFFKVFPCKGTFPPYQSHYLKREKPVHTKNSKLHSPKLLDLRT